MARQKLSVGEFREDFDCGGSDLMLAQDIVEFVDEPQSAGLVQAARNFIAVSEAFELALVAACLREGL